jgi:hypothetical protein
MSFSVGVLYSAQEFTAYVSENEVSVDEFTAAFKRFSLAKPEDILQVATKCNWIDFHPNGICHVTKKGKEILFDAPDKSLRVQLCDLISTDEPPWAAKIPHGRQEALKFFPEEVQQCFKEAGLLQGWDADIIDWWDKLSIATRNHKVTANLVTGRTAEKLTIKYETKRVGLEPHWQSIESNFSGYDVLSYVDNTFAVRRMIEVKGTTLPKKQAFCFITRNEWKNAEIVKDYHFHLWCLRDKENPILLDLSVAHMKPHIPSDNGDGAWETTRIPFNCFPDSMAMKFKEADIM